MREIETKEDCMASHNAARTRVGKGSTYGYKQQSELIVQCARKRFELKGVRKTTLAEIAHEAGITRELIYYYFSGKDEIVQGVLDLYVQDAADSVRLWCEQCEAMVDDGGKISKEAMEEAIASVRRFVFQQNGELRPMFTVLDEIGERRRFMQIVSDLVYQIVAESRIAGKVHAAFPRFSDEDGPMALKRALMGVIGVMAGNNARDNAHIVNLLLSGTT